MKHQLCLLGMATPSQTALQPSSPELALLAAEGVLEAQPNLQWWLLETHTEENRPHGSQNP
ncbi:hypothetical protein P7K49_030955, partial [Saguinus oedipus]